MIGNSLSEFYKSSEWKKLLATIKLERMNGMGEIVCEYCQRPIVRKYDCIGHHKEELTEENYTDAMISLNPDNVALIHHKCHNIIHSKLSHNRRNVFLVFGSPMSGKTSYVQGVRSKGDLVVDMDSIWECISGAERYAKSPRLNAVAFGVRDYLIDCVKYRRGKWQNAYVVGGYPLISERERLAKELGARVIHIDTDMDTCLQRLYSQDERDVEEWSKYITDWWDKYTPHVDE